MLTHRNIAWTVESLFRAHCPRRPRRQAGHLVPADGPHRRADDLALPRHILRVTRSRPAPTRAARRRIAVRFGRRSSSASRGCGRSSTPGVTANLSADPDRATKFNEAVEAALPIVEATSRGTRHRRARGDAGSSSTLPRSRHCANCSASTTLMCAVTGAAPIPRELFNWFRAIGVPLSEIYGLSEIERSDDVGPLEGSRRHRRPGDTRVRGASRGRWRGPLPRRQRLRRLPRRSGEDRRSHRRGRLLALGRHRRVRRRRLPAHRRPQEGADHHRRRQEHQPGEPRSDS